MKFKNLLIVIIFTMILSAIFTITLNIAVKGFQQSKIYKATDITLDKIIENK